MLTSLSEAAEPPDHEPASALATCPMCHTQAPYTRSAIDAGGDWQCVQCGQHWNASRLAAVAAYAVWVAEHDRVARRVVDGGQAPLRRRDPLNESLDGTR